MMELTGDRNFVLGMPDGEEYRRSYVQLAKAFRRKDVPEIVEPLCARVSGTILDRRLRIDAIQDLMAAVPTLLCDEYFGVDIPDKVAFAQWTVGMSAYMFGPPGNRGGELARSAAKCYRAVIDESLRKGGKPDSVIARLLEMKRSDPTLTDAVIQAHVFGMIIGLIPTNLIAAGNILDTLLRFPRFMAPARAAAHAGDDNLLWRCLQEALRFQHINPGTWRKCAKQPHTIAAGTAREKTIPAGATLLVSVQSAMFDPRAIERPKEFNPNRRGEDYLVFGYGQHWCIGASIAMTQITQTFKVLLKKKGLRRAEGDAGRLQRIGAYPLHLMLKFDP
jgi:cytochrome P450